MAAGNVSFLVPPSCRMPEVPRVRQVTERVNDPASHGCSNIHGILTSGGHSGVRAYVAHTILRAYILYKYKCYGTSITSVSALCISPQREALPMVIILNTFPCPWILASTVIACCFMPAIGSVSAHHERQVQRFPGSSTSSRR